jgi:hypothetical protein
MRWQNIITIEEARRVAMFILILDVYEKVQSILDDEGVLQLCGTQSPIFF